MTALNSVVVMEARQIEMHLTRFKGKGVEMGHIPTSDLLFRENENPFSARQLSDFREVGKRYVNGISRVERLPDQKDQKSKETLSYARQRAPPGGVGC